MVMDRLSFETQPSSTKVSDLVSSSQLIDGLTHSDLHPDKYPGNFFEEILPINQINQFKDNYFSGTKGEL